MPRLLPAARLVTLKTATVATATTEKAAAACSSALRDRARARATVLAPGDLPLRVTREPGTGISWSSRDLSGPRGAARSPFSPCESGRGSATGPCRGCAPTRPGSAPDRGAEPRAPCAQWFGLLSGLVRCVTTLLCSVRCVPHLWCLSRTGSARRRCCAPLDGFWRSRPQRLEVCRVNRFKALALAAGREFTKRFRLLCGAALRF